MQAIGLWRIWQVLLNIFRPAFTKIGFRRFVQWITALVLNSEEHTITQSLIASDQQQYWKAIESFVESGRWNSTWIESQLTDQIDLAPGRIWYGYKISALDDTKVHRSSANVWGTNTFYDYTARCPNRAKTVRAHNWVVVGALLENPNQPPWFLPIAARLYFRKSQLPEGETFHTKCELAVELFRRQARFSSGRHLAVFDGGYALSSVVRPLIGPDDGSPRIDFLTRLRGDARLYRLPPTERRAGQRGPMPRWGKRLSPPKQGGRWPGQWQKGRAFLYGRMRTVRWKEVTCLWWVSGHQVTVKAVVAEVEGFSKRFTLVSSAVELTGLQLVQLYAARFRQEDGFRDLKQRLGWEECRAWTKNPILRTTQVLLVLMSLLRLLQFELEAQGESWWQAPPWNAKKDRPSILDGLRLWRTHSSEIRELLAAWLEEEEKQQSESEDQVVM